MFDPVTCNSTDMPLQDELLRWIFVVHGAFYFVKSCCATVDDSYHSVAV